MNLTYNRISIAFSLLAVFVAAPAAHALSTADELEMQAILKRVVAPTFPSREFRVGDYGAVGDGKSDCHDAFARAITACNQAGGGRVLVPPGVFVCDGPIVLQSNVDLHVSDGATIKFGAAPDRYLPAVLTRFEGTMLYGHSPRIYVRGATNVAITGKGTLDGNGKATLDLMKNSPVKREAGSGTLRGMGDKSVPVAERRFDSNARWLRPSMIQPFECTNVLIEGITVLDSTFWCIHPVFCRNVTVRGVRVDSMNGNNDGCDPDSCTDVLIENCSFHTGDDSIAIKSGRDLDGRTVGRPTENVVIRHVAMGSRHSGLCIGSEMSGDVRNVFMEDCTADSVSSALYFKGNLDRGGTVEHVRVRRVKANSVRDGLVRFDTTYRSQDLRGGRLAPVFRDYVIEDISCHEAASFGLLIEGLPGAPIRDVVIRRATITRAKTPLRIERVENVRLEGVKINGEMMPERPSAATATPTLAALKQFTAFATARGLGEVTTPRTWSEPSVLPTHPGRGVAEHSMLYAGEGYNVLSVVHDGQVMWQYEVGPGGEIDDVWMLSSGHILFTRQNGIEELTPDRKVAWHWSAPAGTEVHSAQPIGSDRVAFVLNGLPPKIMVLNQASGAVELEVPVPAESATDPKTVHPQFRRMRVTADGTFLLSFLRLGKVAEFDRTGRELWAYEARSPWSATRLKNGNTLIVMERDGVVREVNRAKETVWEVRKVDLPANLVVRNIQTAERLANGNTVLFCNTSGMKPEQRTDCVQGIELTPEKQVVWVLQDWRHLGPATTAQFLDQPGVPEQPGDFQH